MNTLYKDFLAEIAEMPVIDTHEHLESEAVRTGRKIDFFNTYMMQYASCDLISAGMPDEDMEYLKGEADDLDGKWEKFRPYWEKARNTTYCKALSYSVKEIYGIDDISTDTYKAIDRTIKENNRTGFYKRVLIDICRIEKSIIDSDANCDKEFFVSAVNLDSCIRFKSKDTIIAMEKQYNVSINSLADWVNLFKKILQDQKNQYGVVCFKSALAYQRSIRYDRTDFMEAEKIFNRILSSKDYLGWYAHSPAEFPTKPLEDFMMHIVVQTAVELELPLQFHTGLQEGNGNVITNANPVNLVNLFLEYPKAQFDLFHAGYPYAGELCTLVKNFKNVYVDLCWAHIISREYTVRFIEELLDTVPSNKIFGFGGDYCFVEGVCGHLKIARENIALALANKVNKSYLSKAEALEIARRLLCDNAKEFFRLKY